MRILLAEDERSLSRILITIFRKHNYAIDAVYDGEAALDHIQSANYDAAVLDIMMPKVDGITVLKKIRKTGNRLPVLMLTAKAETEDKVVGLDSGANDYLAKPFDTDELLARIRAITRDQETATHQLKIGNITLDRNNFELMSPTGCFRLAHKEFQMMDFLMTNPFCSISNDRFMERIWGHDEKIESRIVWVYISYLRSKLAALRADIQICEAGRDAYSLDMMI